MNKYVVTAEFEWKDDAIQVIPEHREYINTLIDDQVIEHYAVSMEGKPYGSSSMQRTKRRLKESFQKRHLKNTGNWWYMN